VRGTQDWSGKPGFRREAPEMRPKREKKLYSFYKIIYCAGVWGNGNRQIFTIYYI
jgi:hypothetical protein